MNSSSKAQSFLEAHIALVQPLESRHAEVAWSLATAAGATADDSAAASAALKSVYSAPDTYALALKLLESTKHPQLHRQLQLVVNACASNQMEPSLLSEMSRLEASIEDRFNHFRGKVDGEEVSDNQIRSILHHSDDLPHRRQAWEAAKAIGAEVADDVRHLARLRNQGAQKMGHRDHFAMSLAHQELDENWMMGLLAELEAQTRGPFLKLKERLDKRLSSRFALKRGAPVMPWHYADPFFQDLPPGEDGLDLDVYFEDVDTVDICGKYFSAIGLPVDDILTTSDLFERDGKNQHAFCTRLDRVGDVRILTNLRNDEGWTSTLLHELGHAAYDKGIPIELPWLLRDVSHALTTEAVALMFERLTRHGPWLREWLGLSDQEASTLGAQASRSLSEGQLVFCRWCLVMVYFEKGLYADPEQDLDKLWWQLVERFQGISPPAGRKSPDWAAKIHVSNVPVYYQNYLIGELVASQMWQHLTGRVLADAPDPSAAMATDPRLGGWMTSHIFEPGASQIWTDHVTKATGQPLRPHYYGDFITSGG